MKSQSKNCVRLLAIVAAMAYASAAQAGYFVRPYISLDGGIIDGYEQNGATQRSENFNTAHQVQVDLSSGTVRSSLQITGPGASGQSSGVFGDRLTFAAGASQSLGFSFDFDGVIRSAARDANLNSLLQIGVYASLVVFDSDAGATYRDFDTRTGALVRSIK